MADCLNDLINLCPDAKVEEGLVINGSRVYKSCKEIEEDVYKRQGYTCVASGNKKKPGQLSCGVCPVRYKPKVDIMIP